MGEVQVHALGGRFGFVSRRVRCHSRCLGERQVDLLNIFGGLDTPTSGSVAFLDHNLSGADEDEKTRYRREHVGFVFQFYNLIAGPRPCDFAGHRIFETGSCRCFIG